MRGIEEEEMKPSDGRKRKTSQWRNQAEAADRYRAAAVMNREVADPVFYIA